MAQTNDCGCCGGIAPETPAAKFNRPGQPAIAYRIGVYDDFRASLEARLSSADFPALAGLKTRAADDYSIALCDAFSVMADVLTFYQERIANEAYLRTATERRSALELARLIGYQLAPGVAARTALAFNLQEAPGQPAEAARPVTIAVGARVQSVPDPGETPQTFETTGEIVARVEWNAIPPQRTEQETEWTGRTELHLAGTATQLQPGDALLFVGAESGLQSGGWALRLLTRVETDTLRNMTRVGWSYPIGSLGTNEPKRAGHIHAMRQRAALFGAAAPDPRLIFSDNNPDSHSLTTGKGNALDWANFSLPSSTNTIDLDALYPRIAQGGWLVIGGADWRLYRVAFAGQIARRDFGLSAKVTRVILDRSDNLSGFGLRETSVFAQSEALALAARPLPYPLSGGVLALDRVETELAPGRLVAVSGKRQRVVIGAHVAQVAFPDDPTRQPRPGASFVTAASPQALIGGTAYDIPPALLDPASSWLAAFLEWAHGKVLWRLEDDAGRALRVTAPAGAIALQQSRADDRVVSEVATIASADSDPARTTLALTTPLVNCYERASVTINANTAPASHGETVGEIGGNGDAALANQRFRLKQPPLTYVASSTDPSGRAATLEARVNDLLWTEAPTLYGRGPRERIYVLRQDDSGATTVQFGDGVEGARLPTGQNNLRFRYRKGVGAAGNLRAGQLTNLLTRPLGVQAAVNPAPAQGGEDPETLDDARRNAPIRTLTLGRAVSARDYADFARAFAGVAKAEAIYIRYGRGRGVHLTVAGQKGAAVPVTTIADLFKALRSFGDALIPLTVQSYLPAAFTLRAAIRIDADADRRLVLPAVETALRGAYSFEARDFGQPVTIDEVYAVIAGLSGVSSVDVSQLYRTDAGPSPDEPSSRIFGATAAIRPDGSVSAAEILTLSDRPLEIGAIP